MSIQGDFVKGVVGTDKRILITQKLCPKCNCNLFVKRIDMAWCINTACPYSEMHIVGNGAYGIPALMYIKVKSFEYVERLCID